MTEPIRLDAAPQHAPRHARRRVILRVPARVRHGAHSHAIVGPGMGVLLRSDDAASLVDAGLATYAEPGA